MNNKFKKCTTVRTLIKELEKLPKDAKLNEPARIVIYWQSMFEIEAGEPLKIGFTDEN